MEQKEINRPIWERVLLYTGIGLYLIILATLLFFKGSAARTLNIIPFHTIFDYLSNDAPLAISNVVGNVLLFIPMGVYLMLFCPNKGILRALLWVVLASVFVEVVQYIAQAGAADIDDVILNGVGGLFGIVLYNGLHRLCKEKVRFVISLISMAVGALFLFVAVGLWTGIFGIYIRII